VIGVLKTALQHDLGWSETDYANLVLAFQNAHSVGMLLGGRLIDWLGTRVGFALARVAWSLAAMAHGMMTWLAGLPGGAFCLWFRRSRVLPASLAECFQKERAGATGIFTPERTPGAIITPLIVLWITIHWGWRSAFFLIGGRGFVWVALWLWIYRKPGEHPCCSRAELEYIRSGPP
jgi:ACS family hexuronate transporter-like MFS transporter